VAVGEGAGIGVDVGAVVGVAEGVRVGAIVPAVGVGTGLGVRTALGVGGVAPAVDVGVEVPATGFAADAATAGGLADVAAGWSAVPRSLPAARTAPALTTATIPATTAPASHRLGERRGRGVGMR
jgi:hypothetical protein